MTAACGDRRPPLVLPGGPGGNMINPRQDPNAAYTEGLDLKNNGNCAAAIEKLRPVANMGPGYENAQTALGSCLLTVGEKNGEMSADYLDGMTWLRRAADAGWPEAQGALAKAHVSGPVTLRNGAEAAYWLALYQANSGKMRVGFVALSDADLKAVESALSAADKAAGAARAQEWKRQVWLPPQPQPGARPGATEEGARPQRRVIRRGPPGA